MQYLYSCHTDTGIRRKINQDAYVVKAAKIGGEVFLLAAVCDGVGGFSCGEKASGEVILSFADWFDYELPQVSNAEEDCDTVILHRWKQLVDMLNRKLDNYGRRQNIRLATTATIVLFAWNKYYVCHVGDCRFYAINSEVRQITRDHSLVEQEVEAGRLTLEQAERDSRQNIILQCIGAMEEVTPDLLIGRVESDTTYLLCSDGFRHRVRKEELKEGFFPDILDGPDRMKEQQIRLTELVKNRGEKDNITVITIKAVGED